MKMINAANGLNESILLEEHEPFYYPNSNSMCLHQVPTSDRYLYKPSKIQEKLTIQILWACVYIQVANTGT